MFEREGRAKATLGSDVIDSAIRADGISVPFPRWVGLYGQQGLSEDHLSSSLLRHKLRDHASELVGSRFFTPASLLLTNLG